MSGINKPQIGITLGDPAGIGAEVTAKALRMEAFSRRADICIIGSPDCLAAIDDQVAQSHRVIDPRPLMRRIRSGHPTSDGAAASFAYLQTAVAMLKNRELHALVTAPVSKQAINRTGTAFHGHTEFFQQAFDVPNVEMMFVSGTLRTLIVTRHIPIGQVSQHLTHERLRQCFRLSDETLRRMFHIAQPRIAVCGLNPHAGEEGLMGSEEIETILPAIKAARRARLNVEGPFPADTLFAKRAAYDLIIAMYHDQGLIPVKTLAFDQVVNVTVGLPVIRTSPSHGTAFDIAGKNCARPESMIAAIDLAINLATVKL